MRAAWIVLMAGCGFQAQVTTLDGTGGTVAPTDAAAFDFATCPVSYDAALPGPSRYRLIKEGHRAWEQSDICAQDMVGATHLIEIDTMKELGDVAALIDTSNIGIAGNAIWIGGVQQMTATSPSDGWLGLDGQPLLNGWGGQEPDDGGGDESNHEEQFVTVIENRPYFTDARGDTILGAMCECDGKPLSAAAAALITVYRPKS
jgi:hypothetical protein